MIYGFYRRDAAGRPPARAGGAAAGAQKSLAAPSYSRIIAHSFARTHDTFTNTKPKSISRLGSLKDSPPQPPISYRFQQRVNRTTISQHYHVSITSVSHRFHISITSVSHRYHISITSVSNRSITSVSHWYRIGITSVSQRYHNGIPSASQPI